MDSETGGLNPKEADILTLFMALTDENLKVIAELDLKLKPNDRNPTADEGALKVNKIDIKAHLNDPNTITYKEAKTKIIDFVTPFLKKTGRHSNLIVLGQNVAFDLDFIWEHIIPKNEWNGLFSYNVEDTKTASLFLKRCGWLPSDIGTLKSLVEFFGIAKREAHEAKGDVHMTIDVYKAMISLMESKKDSGGQTQDLISLLEAE
jgi:DNA polymerase III epsilon subunit-like protein